MLRFSRGYLPYNIFQKRLKTTKKRLCDGKVVFSLIMQGLLEIARRSLRWVIRFRKRRGYGIHSPFAFNFVTGVIYENGEYYAFERLRQLYAASPLPKKWRLKDCLLLFRLANYAHPEKCLWLLPDESLLRQFCEAGSPKTQFMVQPEPADMIVCELDNQTESIRYAHLLKEGGMLIVLGIGRDKAHRKAWKALLAEREAQVTFDLHDFGIIFHRPDLTRQRYIINYL